MLAEVCAPAVERLLVSGGKGAALFTQSELDTLSEALAGTLAAADLLGRSRLRKLVDRTQRFSERPWNSKDVDLFADFADPVPVLSPEAALDYFRSLVPSLTVNVDTYGTDMRKRAFAIAGVVEQSLLAEAKQVIDEGLQSGAVADAQLGVQDVLERVGVGGEPWRAERIIRTEFGNAYNNGSWDEFVVEAEEFPAWRFSNPNDGRSRPHHAANDGKVFPTSTRFEDVRGHGPGEEINCRCTFIPLHRSEAQVSR